MLIKIFKKYSLFGRLLRFTNWIILSIFSISVIDNFGLDFFRNLFLKLRIILGGIITYLSNTQFYGLIASIFKTKEDVTKPKISIGADPVSWESSRNESEIRQAKRNSKISDWLNPEPEVIEESNNTKKYIIIAGMVIIIGCLSWYYWDEVSSVGPFIRDYFRGTRPGNDGDGAGNNGLNTGNVQPRLDVKQRIKNLFNKTNSEVSQIDLQDYTHNVASGSNVKLDNSPNSPSSNNSMDQYFSKPIEEQPTGLRPITGQNFTG